MSDEADYSESDEHDENFPIVAKKVASESDEVSESENAEPVEEEEGEEVGPESINVSNNAIVIVVVAKDKRRTSNKMTSFEYTEAISIRAQQIATYNNCQVDISGLTSPIDMAERELLMGKNPLTLRRTVGFLRGESGVIKQYVEDWDVEELQLPSNIINPATIGKTST